MPSLWMSCGRRLLILSGVFPPVAGAQAPPDTGAQLGLAPSALGLQPDPAAPTSIGLTVAADRPGLGDSTQIVPVGHVGLELGYTFTYSKHDGVKSWTHDAPEALLRIGVCDDRLELRCGTTGYIHTRTSDESGTAVASGFTDVTPGVKVRLWDQETWVPRVCLLASTTVGLGSRAVSNRDVGPMLEATWTYALSERLELDGSFAGSYASDGEDRFVQGSASVSAFYQFTTKTGGFAEYFLVGPTAVGSGAAHYIDVGITYLLSDRVQLDMSVGLGLNEEADRFFAGAGIGFLF